MFTRTLSLKGVSVGGGGTRVWALDKTGAAYVRHGISEEVPTGEQYLIYRVGEYRRYSI